MSYIAFCSSRNTHEGSDNQESMKNKKRRDETSTFIQLQFIGRKAKIQISKRVLQEKTKYAKFCKKRIIFTEYLACLYFLVTRSEIRPFALLPTNLCFVLRTVVNNESTHIRPVTPHHPPENIWRK